MPEKTVSTRLKVGMPAPDLVLTDVQDQSAHLAALWANGPTLLTFLRHFG